MQVRAFERYIPFNSNKPYHALSLQRYISGVIIMRGSKRGGAEDPDPIPTEIITIILGFLAILVRIP